MTHSQVDRWRRISFCRPENGHPEAGESGRERASGTGGDLCKRTVLWGPITKHAFRSQVGTKCYTKHTTKQHHVGE